MCMLVQEATAVAGRAVAGGAKSERKSREQEDQVAAHAVSQEAETRQVAEQVHSGKPV